MASNVGNSLLSALFGSFFCPRGLLLSGEALLGCLELLLVDNEEVAGAALGEVRLRQDVLHARDG